MSVFMDSPIEALAFDHLSFGIFTVVNNLWTWIALVTAAVSFWRIRASSAVISISLKSHPISNAPESIRSHSNSPDVSFPEPEIHSERQMLSPPSTPSVFVDDDSVTKGKFLVYYEDDRGNDGGIGEGEDGSESEAPVAGEWEYSGCGECRESFERLLRMRMGDLGWYRYQDLTAINGNVVRLWDGVRI